MAGEIFHDKGDGTQPNKKTQSVWCKPQINLVDESQRVKSYLNPPGIGC